MAKESRQQETLRRGKTPAGHGEPDAVDAIVEQWRRERPDLDASAKHVTGRIVRLHDLLQRRFATAFEQAGLDGGGYGVLAALRRAGSPYELTPTDLTRQLMVTSGGTTGMVDRLERQGLVTRGPHPTDRRGVIVRLTDAGHEVVDRAMELHADAEHEVVSVLDAGDREELGRLLRIVLRSLEPS